ncbi:Rap1a/Tai family immunity protein [Bradyrhizobium sp. 170]|uniref:Rap1a/Tai family immunity protein n=1 Tax=Bradyrhizobium sp. 170 TaxID=2782641 RepID=UPI001FFFF9AA|nr:Rap1a/Tai family immunity protein [Bradyrhizobium sp. 170]UPK04517.1 hypothetical protein IVB05_01840 [Bradyrhizobium sp. 170]
MRALAAACVLIASAAHAAEVPPTAFYSGNDVYDWCRNDRRAAFSYVAGLYDSAAHAAAVIDSGRHFGKDMPNNDIEVDFAMDRVVGYCKPDRVTLEQVTDVFCGYLKDNPAKRDGLPAIMFPDALKKAWPCPKK